MIQKKEFLKNLKASLWLIIPLSAALLAFVLLAIFLGPNLPKDEPKVLKLQVSSPIEIRLVVPENVSQKEEGPPRFTGGSR